MRIPKIESHSKDIETKTIHISDVEPLDYSIEYPFNRDKLIKRIEKIVRQSYEYKELITFLKEEMDLDHCLLLSSLDLSLVKLELHHDPLRLYDVVDTVIRKHEKKVGEDNLNVFDIAEEVMEIHFKGMIPLVPITTTVHELIHAGEVFIPIQLIKQGGWGDYKLFYNEYKAYMTPDFIGRLEDYIDMSNKVISEYNVPILERKYTYLSIDGMSLPRRIPVEDEEAM